VALKNLPLHGRIDPVQIERFRLESRSAARLHHGNIVPVYGMGEHQGVYYAVIATEVRILFTFLQYLLWPRLLARPRLPGGGRRSRTVDSGRPRRPRTSDRARHAVPAALGHPTVRVP